MRPHWSVCGQDIYFGLSCGLSGLFLILFWWAQCQAISATGGLTSALGKGHFVSRSLLVCLGVGVLHSCVAVAERNEEQSP